MNCCTHWNQTIGPNAMMESWSWNWNDSSDDSGTGGIPNSYTLNDSGTYTLGLNSGLCTMESEPMTRQVPAGRGGSYYLKTNFLKISKH